MPSMKFLNWVWIYRQHGAYVAGSGCQDKQFKSYSATVIKAHVLDLQYTLHVSNMVMLVMADVLNISNMWSF